MTAPPDLPPSTIDRGTLFARALAADIIENALHAILAPAAGHHAARHHRSDTERGGRNAARVGIDPADAARILRPYSQQRATGTGLGLTIAKRNVELIGGERLRLAASAAEARPVTLARAEN